MKTRKVKVVDVNEWDRLVRETYGKPYSFQQQDGCKERGMENLKVPADYTDYKNDSIVEKVNGPEEGVSFKAWLARDITETLKDEKEGIRKTSINTFWNRNFYPNVSMIINDLYKKGLLKKGEFSIDIDW